MNLVSLLFHDVYVRDPDESGFSSPAADRYKLSLDAFEKQLASVANVRHERPLLATDLIADADRIPNPETRSGLGTRDSGLGIQNSGFGPRTPGPGSRVPRFTITVDDGGMSYYTVIADRLEALGWRGHCFVTTDMIGRRGFLTVSQLRELDARGHVIGSHSASHPTRFSRLRLDEMSHEWTHSQRVLEDLLGRSITTASVPGGYFSRVVAKTAAQSGMRLLFTSEPTVAIEHRESCMLAGRFTVRRGCPPDQARRLVEAAPWARFGAWASWNAKGLIKPVLGGSYIRMADLLQASRPSTSR